MRGLPDAESLVVTVRGAIKPGDLGVTLSHDHLLVDTSTPTDLAGTDYAGILDDVDLASEEVRLFRESGGRSICDPTNVGLGRNPLGLTRISQATRVNIIAGCGWYRERVYPAYVYEESVGQLADRMVQDLTVGIEDTRVRAGFIGEIGTERRYISPAQERVFRAAARAHRLTGAPIMTHTTHWGDLALEQVDLLESEGVQPRRMIVSHLGDRRSTANLMVLAKRGVYISIDNLAGWLDYLPLDIRANNVAALWSAGFGEQLLLGSDICRLDQLRAYGGPGYSHVIHNFWPLLLARGLTEADVQQMMVTNPARAFAYAAGGGLTAGLDGLDEPNEVDEYASRDHRN